jgi:protein-tyrosine phosphatase
MRRLQLDVQFLESTPGLSATNRAEKCFFISKEKTMSRRSHPLRSLLLAAALASSLAGIGCAEHHAYRVYDPYYTDYHVWNNDEVVYYHRWADENHRDRDRDFKKLRPEEQKEYWTWRHNHGDHDGDKDRDRNKDHH